LVFIFYFAVFYIRRIADDYIEPSFTHNAVKLNEPVEGLVRFEPGLVFLTFGILDAILARKQDV